jgi:glyoxylase-like metal-dependent hydrolase (beta-lactamase superfamily II)
MISVPGGGNNRTELLSLVVGPLDVDCYVYWDVETREAFVIDPGGDPDRIISALKDKSIDVKFILNTHGHFDHVGGNGVVKAETGAQICINKADAALYAEAEERGAIFGVPTVAQPVPDIYLQDGAKLSLGTITLEVIYTPGHTPGGVSFYSETDRLLFTGDTLFAGSIGRTDLEGGSFDTLMESIKTRILPLDDSVRVLPGHGPDTTVGEERESNAFIVNIRL